MELKDILAACDHTLLRPDCTAEEIRALCDEAIRYGCASVCIPPSHVFGAKKYVGNRMRVCTVIGFPNGYATTPVKVFEAQDALRHGADELDMVVNLGMVKDAAWGDVLEDIRAVRRVSRGKILKVIVETGLLTEQEKIQLCAIVTASDADYIKTSTGFTAGGATFEDVALLREHVGPKVKVKAAGGISSLEDAARFLELGADRLGTSRIVKLAMAQEQEAAAGRDDSGAPQTEDFDQPSAEPDDLTAPELRELPPETEETAPDTLELPSDTLELPTETVGRDALIAPLPEDFDFPAAEPEYSSDLAGRDDFADPLSEVFDQPAAEKPPKKKKKAKDKAKAKEKDKDKDKKKKKKKDKSKKKDKKKITIEF